MKKLPSWSPVNEVFHGLVASRERNAVPRHLRTEDGRQAATPR